MVSMFCPQSASDQHSSLQENSTPAGILTAKSLWSLSVVFHSLRECSVSGSRFCRSCVQLGELARNAACVTTGLLKGSVLSTVMISRGPAWMNSLDSYLRKCNLYVTDFEDVGAAIMQECLDCLVSCK